MVRSMSYKLKVNWINRNINWNKLGFGKVSNYPDRFPELIYNTINEIMTKYNLKEYLSDWTLDFRNRDLSSSSFIRPTEKLFRCHFEGLGANDVRYAIWHEFGHILDFQSGKIRIDDGYVYWNDEILFFPLFPDRHEYASLPHELSANVFATMHCSPEEIPTEYRIQYDVGKRHLLKLENENYGIG